MQDSALISVKLMRGTLSVPPQVDTDAAHILSASARESRETRIMLLGIGASKAERRELAE